MRFKQQRSSSQMPEVNLVPMMDVLMTVLTFFIIISMTLSGQQLFNVQLPRTDGAGSQGETARKAMMVVGLDADSQIMLSDRPATETDLVQEMQAFLTKNPEGTVLLKADRSLNYKAVTQLLKIMRDIGGDRVSLAITQG